MPTYSPNLAFNLPNDGEYSGTWGQITNNNIGILIEQAISGYVTQAITDGADTVITIPLGATGVARNMYIEGTGALSATRNLVVPANKKMYFFFNNTSGGQSVTVKVSGQTGVTVPPGGKAALVCNGTDIVVAENFFGAVDINGGTIDNAAIGLTTPSTGAFTTVTVSGATIPVNGMYLPAANTLALSTLSLQRWKVDGVGLHTFAAATAAGPTLVITAAANDTVNVIQFPTRGTMINFARSADGALTGFVGSRAGTSNFSLYNTGGVSAEVEVGGGTLNMYTNNVQRSAISATGIWQLWEGTYNVGAAAMMVAGTVETGSFIGTLTGISNGPQTGTIYYRRTGSLVCLTMEVSIIGTSNSTACTITGMPAGLSPIRTCRASSLIQSSAANEAGYLQIAGSSVIITLVRANGTATFVNDGLNKGPGPIGFTYALV